MGRDGRPGRLRGRDPAPDRRAVLQLDHRPATSRRSWIASRRTRCWSTACCSRRSTSRWRRAVRPRRCSTPPYTIFRGGPLVEMFAPGAGDRERAPRRARASGGREARRHPRRLRVRDRRGAEGVRARRAGRGQRAAHRTGARRTSAVPRDRRGRRPRRVDAARPRQPQHQRAGPGRPAAAVRRRRRAVAGARHRDDRPVDRSRIRDGGRQHAGGAVRAARRDPAVGVTGDHARRSRHHDGRARSRRAAAVHADGPRPVLQRRAGPGPRRGPDADAGRRQRRDRAGRDGHPRRRPLRRPARSSMAVAISGYGGATQAAAALEALA